MISPLQREALLDVIERCAWLIDYYENTGVALQTVDFLRSTMQRAMNDLETVSPSIQVEYHQLHMIPSNGRGVATDHSSFKEMSLAKIGVIHRHYE